MLAGSVHVRRCLIPEDNRDEDESLERLDPETEPIPSYDQPFQGVT
jgi:hypothetical protein